MSVIATFCVASDDFPLGESIKDQSNAEIEMERIVPMRDSSFPYFFIWDCTDYESFEKSIESISEVDSMTLIEDFDNGRLYKLTWVDGQCPLIKDVISNEGIILSARGDPKEWMFEIRFPERGHVSQFFTEVIHKDKISIELRSLYEETEFELVEENSVLTEKQEFAIKTAFEKGYFSVPRRANLSDIAQVLDITPSATSSLLRRGSERIIQSALNKK